MPERLWDSTSVRILKWFTTMDASEGVGAKQEQMTIRMSICRDQSQSMLQTHHQHLSAVCGVGRLGQFHHAICVTLGES